MVVGASNMKTTAAVKVHLHPSYIFHHVRMNWAKFQHLLRWEAPELASGGWVRRWRGRWSQPWLEPHHHRQRGIFDGVLLATLWLGLVEVESEWLVLATGEALGSRKEWRAVNLFECRLPPTDCASEWCSLTPTELLSSFLQMTSSTLDMSCCCIALSMRSKAWPWHLGCGSPRCSSQVAPWIHQKFE